eukprot:TRINITY_DN2076_c0_g1_i1.p4 TRINITY_DN2076_c0_g1~~TRINITY_DN2076_c0_g1_i1.p4  ORF type:complete len:53 (+),score=1.98 TRINITY_DN2076_c0_g1_i1:491-649(+)
MLHEPFSALLEAWMKRLQPPEGMPAPTTPPQCCNPRVSAASHLGGAQTSVQK